MVYSQLFLVVLFGTLLVRGSGAKVLSKYARLIKTNAFNRKMGESSKLLDGIGFITRRNHTRRKTTMIN